MAPPNPGTAAMDAVDQLDQNTAVTSSGVLDVKKQQDDDFDAFKTASDGISVPAMNTTSTVHTTTPTSPSTAATETSSTSTTINDKQQEQQQQQEEKQASLATTSSEEKTANTAAVTETTPNPQTEATTQPAVSHRNKRFVTPKDFELLKVIGMGAFGKVLQVRNRQSGQVLAMKVISKRRLRRKTDNSYVDNVQAERNIMVRVKSPFVVTMHCSFQTKEKLFIIMDFLAGGELFLLLGREGIFLEKTAAFYLAEIILALKHLHSLGILHRDLKPENILLGQDGHVCLTDFGLAKDFGDGSIQSWEQGETNRALTICGTQEYMAPEMVSRRGYCRAADYWSLGCIAYEMLSGQPPFKSTRQGGSKELFRKIMTEKVKMPDGSSAAACKLLKGLLNRNAQNRLGTARSTMFEVGGVAALKKADFFQTIDWEALGRKEIAPPAVLEVDNDGDLRHFHDEFTKMALPRSVVDMSMDAYRPKRTDSEAFRGFSFIQDDFALPERHPDEDKKYWESVEEDGESASDGASSKAALEDVVPLEAPKKKRPPRKRKKKKPQEAPNSAVSVSSTIDNTPLPSNANTPVVSAANSPAPSENGDAVQPNLNEATAVVVSGINHADAGVACAPNQPAKVPAPKIPASLPGPTPVTTQRAAPAPAPKPVDSWHSVGTTKSKQKGKAQSVALPSQVRGKPQQQQKVIGQQGWRTATPKSTPPPLSQKASQSNWTKSSASARPSAGSPWSQQQQRSVRAPPPAPSSDWRNHPMSPRESPKRLLGNNIGQPSWPTLADPPLSSKASSKPKVQGAWASRTKR